MHGKVFIGNIKDVYCEVKIMKGSNMVRVQSYIQWIYVRTMNEYDKCFIKLKTPEAPPCQFLIRVATGYFYIWKFVSRICDGFLLFDGLIDSW